MKDNRILILIVVIFTFIVSTMFSYAYFETTVSGNEKAKMMEVNVGTMQLVYVDGEEIKADNLYPGDSISKKIYVKNTGTLNSNYSIIIDEYINTFINDEIIVNLNCVRKNNSDGSINGVCDGLDKMILTSKNIKENIVIEPGITHEYNIDITFVETGNSQNYNQGKTLSGKINIVDFNQSN